MGLGLAKPERRTCQRFTVYHWQLWLKNREQTVWEDCPVLQTQFGLRSLMVTLRSLLFEVTS